ncbi:ATP-dependent DNA helicase PIF1 [Fusarium albosuccineum]|uniref:ATP-dependent DNA helicase PIF1 n=1 Tax=Fusarium albosuccineum TaxID=1237068 RepID=A0A8H4PHC7_9HYPO|nr:ATP-dependent DNA helicase PIF1 [Fusarium albosuccineum]KAF4994708.1 hypothetical protein FDECE_13042 [Fusarium decemcellulare]
MHRTRDPDEAEKFIETLGNAYKQTRLAISGPRSSAILFHREMKLFFDHYMNVGEASVFERISKYYGAVEQRKRGASGPRAAPVARKLTSKLDACRRPRGGSGDVL